MITTPSSGPARINWEQVRERLRASERALTQAVGGNSERTALAYRKRAAQLAKRQAGLQLKPAGLPVLTFTLQQERYAIPLNRVAEVRALDGFTPVPGAPAQFLGVIHLRGELRPVVDLSRMILGIETPAAATGFVLMLRQPAQEVGLKVDRVDGLHSIARESLESSTEGKYTNRMIGETLMLVDVDKLLADILPKEELSIA